MPRIIFNAASRDCKINFRIAMFVDDIALVRRLFVSRLTLVDFTGKFTTKPDGLSSKFFVVLKRVVVHSKNRRQLRFSRANVAGVTFFTRSRCRHCGERGATPRRHREPQFQKFLTVCRSTYVSCKFNQSMACYFYELIRNYKQTSRYK